MSDAIHATATEAHDHGLSVIPIKTDGSKAPSLTRWKPYQEALSTLDDIDRWFADDHEATGLGLVTGTVSGNLELFEFDDGDVRDRFLAQVEGAGLTDIVCRVMTGYREQTPRGGEHWLYYVDGGGARTTLLAGRPDVNEQGKPYTKALIETKGEGGYVVIAPSHGGVHPSKLPYRLITGGFASIATLTPAERDVLWSLARTFDEQEQRLHRVPSPSLQEERSWLVRPGDAFAAAVDWPAILEPYGWEAVRHQGETILWRRPGGYPGGWGASTNYGGSDLLYVWTSSAPPFEPGRAYGKFAAYTLLNHDGDFRAAAQALADQGYGEHAPTPHQEGPASPGSASSLPAQLTRAAEQVPVPPFPVDALPQVVRAFVEAGAASLGCPVDFVAIPLLVFCGAVAGTSRKMQLKPGFEVLPILWAAVIGRPGAVKTPALNLSRQFLDILQREAWERYEEQLAEWTAQDKEERGPKPLPEHFFATDTTTQGVAFALTSSRGISLIHDELAGWVNSFDAYHKAGDRQFWLSAWSAQPLKPNRRTGDPIFVAEPVVGVTGGIQPDVLSDLLGEAKRDDGFLPRLWLVWPDAPIAWWSDTTVPESVTRAMLSLIQQLRLKGDSVVISTLSPAAYAAWKDWYNDNQRLTAELTGIAAGWAAKAPTHLARIVLLLHLLGDPGNHAGRVDVVTLQHGIAIVEYLRAHLGRVLPVFGALPPTRGSGVAARIERILRLASPEWISRTKLSDELGGHEEAAAIQAALTELAGSGLVESRQVPTGGRTREEWRWLTDDNTRGRTEKRKKVPDETLFPSSSVLPQDTEPPVEPDPTLLPSSSVFPQASLFAEEFHGDEAEGDDWESWEVPE